VKVGIMDPFVSLAARAGHAVFLTAARCFRAGAVALGEHLIAICDSA